MLRQVSLRLEAETGIREVAKRHNATITVLDCKNVNYRDMAFLLDVSSPIGGCDVVAHLKSLGVFKKVYDGDTEGRSSRGVSLAVLKRPGLCQAVLGCGVLCLGCPFRSSE